jgi:hypothetical protein
MRIEITSTSGRQTPYGHIWHDAVLLAVRGPHKDNARFCSLDSLCGGALGALAADADFNSQPGQLFAHALPYPRLQYVVPFGIGSATELALEHSLIHAFRKAQSLGRQHLVLAGLEWTNCHAQAVGETIGKAVTLVNDSFLPGEEPAKKFEALTIMASREHVDDLLTGYVRSRCCG